MAVWEGKNELEENFVFSTRYKYMMGRPTPYMSYVLIIDNNNNNRRKKKKKDDE